MAVEVTTSPVFQVETPKPLFQTPPGTLGMATLDGKRFMLAVPVEQSTPSPWTVVLNWQAGLTK
jgi:hypothetical protein